MTHTKTTCFSQVPFLCRSSSVSRQTPPDSAPQNTMSTSSILRSTLINVVNPRLRRYTNSGLIASIIFAGMTGGTVYLFFIHSSGCCSPTRRSSRFAIACATACATAALRSSLLAASSRAASLA